MEKQKTRIFRQSKASNYTVINNEILRRDDISWKAKGIMCYVLSLPDDWEIYLEELMKHATDGRDSFRSGWKELSEKGYVMRIPVKINGKFVEWRTEIRENVAVEPILPHTGFPIVEKPIVGNPILENPTLLSTYDTKYLNKLNTNNNNKDMVDSKNESDYTSTKISQFEEIWELYPENRRRNKKGCKAKFNKVVRKQADIDKIKTDLLKYGEYIEKANIKDEYIATSSTYFNQERWNDDNPYEVKPQTKNRYGNKNGPVRKETLPDWAKEQQYKEKTVDYDEIRERLKAEGKL